MRIFFVGYEWKFPYFALKLNSIIKINNLLKQKKNSNEFHFAFSL
jgi:hypothetical protein